MRRVHIATLVSGIALTALGVLLVLDADGTLDLRFAYAAPAVIGALGAMLLASGLSRRGRD